MEMEIIRDCLGRIVCKVNAADGTVETKYGKIRVLTRVAIGDSYCIERDNVVTWVTRETREGASATTEGSSGSASWTTPADETPDIG